MMISSYCLEKSKMVEWYIELLTIGSTKYIVTHSLSELESIRNQLEKCHNKIMRVKIEKRNKTFIDIDYTSGYEG